MGADQREGRQARDNTSRSQEILAADNAFKTQQQQHVSIRPSLLTCHSRLIAVYFLSIVYFFCPSPPPLSASSLYTPRHFLLHCTAHVRAICTCILHPSLRRLLLFFPLSASRCSVLCIAISPFCLSTSLCPGYSFDTLDFKEFLPLRVLFVLVLEDLIGDVVVETFKIEIYIYIYICKFNFKFNLFYRKDILQQIFNSGISFETNNLLYQS